MIKRLSLAFLLLLAACTPRREPPGAEITLHATPGKVRFVAVGDTGEGNDGQARVAAGMKAACEAKGCDFALLLGDNLYPRGPESPTDPELRTKIERPYAPLGIPVLAAIGNHDDGGSGWSPERGDHEIAWAQPPSWWKTPARHYRASIGDMDVIVLDTDAILYDRGGEQERNVARWLRETKARFTIVAGHHPLRSNGPHGDAGAYDRLPSLIPVASGRSLKRFLEREVCGKANVYLSAHDHVRAWMKDGCAGTELVVAGTGSKPKAVVDRHPAWFQSGELGFFYGEMGAEGFRGEMMSVEGKVDFGRGVKGRLGRRRLASGSEQETGDGQQATGDGWCSFADGVGLGARHFFVTTSVPFSLPMQNWSPCRLNVPAPFVNDSSTVLVSVPVSPPGVNGKVFRIVRASVQPSADSFVVWFPAGVPYATVHALPLRWTPSDTGAASKQAPPRSLVRGVSNRPGAFGVAGRRLVRGAGEVRPPVGRATERRTERERGNEVARRAIQRAVPGLKARRCVRAVIGTLLSFFAHARIAAGSRSAQHGARALGDTCDPRDRDVTTSRLNPDVRRRDDDTIDAVLEHHACLFRRGVVRGV